MASRNPFNIYLARANEAREQKDPSIAKYYYNQAIDLLYAELKKTNSPEKAKNLLSKIQYISVLRDSDPQTQKVTTDGQQNTTKTKEQEDLEGKINSITPTISDINFADVQGMNALKTTLEKNIIWPVKYAKEMSQYVAKAHTGVILYGPTGCGKSFIIDAVAGESHKLGVSYFNPNISNIKDKYVGESEKWLHAYFKAASENEPAILFFDELDALGGKREGFSKHSDELVNAFLQEFKILKGKIIMVVGATNKPWNIDYALARSMRFDNKIYVPPPDSEARKGMFKFFLSDKRTADNINYNRLSDLTKYYASADIRAICSEAGKSAFERMITTNKQSEITQSDLETAIESKTSSLISWAYQTKEEILDNRYDKPRLKSGIDRQYLLLIETANKIIKSQRSNPQPSGYV